MGRRQTIHIPGVQHNAPIPYGARVGNVIYSSAIQGINADTGELPEDVYEQARQCFRNMHTFLEIAGATPDDIVRLTCFLADLGDRQALNEPWLALFPDENDRPPLPRGDGPPPPPHVQVRAPSGGDEDPDRGSRRRRVTQPVVPARPGMAPGVGAPLVGALRGTRSSRPTSRRPARPAA